jgi:CheY-like chemotaxis protein
MSCARRVDDILDVSRIVSGKFLLHMQAVELLPVVKAALDVVRPAAEAKGIHLQMTMDAAVEAVRGNPERLQQVVWNLLSNAVKFTLEGGRVDLELGRARRYAEITVRDTGRGIDPAFLPYVFDRFRQADSSISRQHGGLGLGLAIVRHLVELHGGTVEAESRGIGFGASFTVKLPLVQSHRAALTHPVDSRLDEPGVEEPGSTVERFHHLAGLHVMVVDDDTETLQMITQMLRLHGMRVSRCESAAEAIDTLKHKKPDILVSDIAMPELDGYEFIGRLRSQEAKEGGHLPAIALTARVHVEDRRRALSAGYQTFISKPVEASELLAAIDALAGGGDL